MPGEGSLSCEECKCGRLSTYVVCAQPAAQLPTLLYCAPYNGVQLCLALRANVSRVVYGLILSMSPYTINPASLRRAKHC